MVFPVQCAGCGERAAAGLCPACIASARVAPPAAAPEGLDACCAALIYEGAVREAVARIKYRNARAPIDLLAAFMDSVLPVTVVADVVTWIPASRERRHRRGFDHAELLARAMARRRRLPARALLRRLEGAPQTARPHADRLVGPSLATRLGAMIPRRVLLVDDVVTTGATLRNAASALRGEGCETVIGVVVARTLLKRRVAISESHADA